MRDTMILYVLERIGIATTNKTIFPHNISLSATPSNPSSLTELAVSSIKKLMPTILKTVRTISLFIPVLAVKFLINSILSVR